MSRPLRPASARPPWVALAVGGAVMAYALRGAWQALGDDRVGWAAWVVGADVVHDALVAPAVGLLGVLVARVVPAGRARSLVQAGLVASGVVLAVAWIPLRGLGGNPGNPTIRPLDYGTATLTALALVWGAVAGTALVGWLRDRTHVRS